MRIHSARIFLAGLVLWTTCNTIGLAAEGKKGGKKAPAAAAQATPAPEPGEGATTVEPPGVQSPLEQIRVLRQQVDKQERELGELRAAVEELRSVSKVREAQPVASIENTPTPASAPAAAAKPEAASAAPPAAVETTRVERAEPVPTGPQHTVAKGETLTSIAKHYNITIAELQKANKVVDDRKLQIGQVLTLPAAKAAETPTEKKENP